MPPLLPRRQRALRLLATPAAAVGLAIASTPVGTAAAATTSPSPTTAASDVLASSSGGAADPNGVVGGGRLGEPKVVLVDAPGAKPVPAPPAESWLLADLDTGEVLAARNPHEKLPPASTLKTLTALTLLPKLDPAHVYTATSDDANAEGSKAGVVPGATYTIDQLWLGLFLPSGNDAAHALAVAGGGLDTTVAAMAATAHELQADDTVPKTPSGLDTPGQVSSAYDLALIARAGLRLPAFAHYASTLRAQFPGKPAAAGKPRPSFQIQNQNKLLWNYDGAIGVKTGYTTIARNTFVGAASRNGHRLVVTIMKEQTGTWRQAEALLNWGFANISRARPVGTLVDPLGPAVSARPAAAHPAKAVITAARSTAPTDSGLAMPLRLLLVAVLLGLAATLLLRIRTVRRRQARRARAAASRRATLARSGHGRSGGIGSSGVPGPRRSRTPVSNRR